MISTLQHAVSSLFLGVTSCGDQSLDGEVWMVFCRVLPKTDRGHHREGCRSRLRQGRSYYSRAHVNGSRSPAPFGSVVTARKRAGPYDLAVLTPNVNETFPREANGDPTCMIYLSGYGGCLVSVRDSHYVPGHDQSSNAIFDAQNGARCQCQHGVCSDPV
ncbi:hypothetical protein GGR55DRAFT_553368 [Xylaria sp. FL0064]|nr:hypothetical protein GGR55DRAFT_553368 [Xylaria sp. FL0064]